ncbi:aminotransferase class I/II-fold pyridoxal phosphate-dependent enzyme [Auraticoccus sp. F435]|uniref:Aromatic amino acid aminotransferase n=1 Tax=Auraticoccus cholistanensis TaxID=2656650 RepID=A0A6A9V189_9ACTN|nr:histidinol-phosphate transaminase [Auraticoccus cholistanensis]MVA76999.1 aminotransferase class I/II-fold pyridoxal phosphate-dependent enzyme [Auraticoccus cholistanensis]
MAVRIRPVVAGLPAYRAGRPPQARPGLTPYKLSSNENPFPPLPGVMAAVEAAARSMNRYPDAGNSAIAEGVAARLGVDAEQVVFGTGSVAVLYQLLQTVCEPGDEVVHAWRSFEAYPIAVQLPGAVGVPVPLTADARHDLDAMAAAITDRTRAVLVCTPNNPTGPVVTHDELVRFCRRVPPEVMVVVDEAYVEFVRDDDAARGLDLLAEFANVVVLRTFSKAYGLAGFRVGFSVSEPGLAEAVRAVTLPFGVSSVAQAAVLASLEAEQELLARVDALVAARTELLTGLRGAGHPVPDTQANFVWLPAGSRTAEWAGAFEQAALTVRPFTPTGTSPAELAAAGLRISVGEPEANARVLEVAAGLR